MRPIGLIVLTNCFSNLCKSSLGALLLPLVVLLRRVVSKLAQVVRTVALVVVTVMEEGHMVATIKMTRILAPTVVP